jgi:type II secretory pathway component PulK
MIISAHFRTNRPRGLASVAVLIALIIIVMICSGLLKVAFARRATVKAEERRLQAAWLAESGLDRASARLRASGDYSGETWNILADDLGGRGTGTVLIQVDSSLRSRQTRESLIPISLPSR